MFLLIVGRIIMFKFSMKEAPDVSPSLHRSSMSSATRWSRSTSMPFLTTPTSSRGRPACRGHPPIIPTSIAHAPQHPHHTHTHTSHAESCICPIWWILLGKKIKSSQLDLWMGLAAPHPSSRKREQAPRTRAAQSDRKFTEMPSWIFCNILVNTALWHPPPPHPNAPLPPSICIYTYCVASYYFGFRHSLSLAAFLGGTCNVFYW